MVPDIETNPFYVDLNTTGYYKYKYDHIGLRCKAVIVDELTKIKIITPKKIIYHNPATIVFWEDGTKTVVKCSPSETYNKYVGFCACLAKRIYGNNSRVNRIVKNGIEEK